MRNTLLQGLLLASALLAAAPAHGAVYVNGSLKSSTFSGGLKSVSSQGGSVGLSVDLGRYIRIGVTHEQDIQTLEGYEIIQVDETTAGLSPVYTVVHTKSNSLDLQLVLYEGTSVVPYLLGGVVKKNVITTVKDADGNPVRYEDPQPAGPQGGVGLGIRMTKDFTLKFQYVLSPGVTYSIKEGKARNVIDKAMSIGLTYQI